MSSKFSFNTTVRFNPWHYFFIFLFSNSLLSYMPLSLTARIGIIFFGLALPFGIGLWTQRTAVVPSAEKVPLPTPSWLWWLAIGFFVFTRFYKLGSLPFWPVSDEGIFAFLGLHQSQQWDWHVLWGEFQSEPFLFWSLGLYFKFVEPSLLSLRCFSTAWSFFSVILAFFIARSLLSGHSRFAFVWLFAFSFWQFALTRYCQPNDLIPFFELLAFLCLTLYLKENKGSGPSWFWFFALSLIAGAGFYAYINWAPIWLILFLVLALSPFQREGHRDPLSKALLFAVLSLVPVTPLVLARLSAHGSLYIQSCWNNGDLFKMIPVYGSGLFWDARPSFPLGPDWGGMLDPVTGTLVMIGILDWWQNRDRRWLGWILLGLGLCVLPGVLTNYLELNRITPSLPFWVFLALSGMEALFRKSVGLSLIGAGLLLALVAGLNFYNLIGPYSDISNVPSERQWRAVDLADAYQKLSTLSHQAGPFYVFDEFNTSYDSKTFNLAIYPFNALENPSLAPAQFAALLIDPQYIPYFKAGFPNVRYSILNTDKTDPSFQKSSVLVVIPTDQIPPERLERWKRAHAFFNETDYQLKNKISTKSWSNIMNSSLIPPELLQDPWIAAIYWEKRGFFDFLDHNIEDARIDYLKASQNIPAAHLYYGVAVCLKWENRLQEAQVFMKRSALASTH